jgi:hypothetical protein
MGRLLTTCLLGLECDVNEGSWDLYQSFKPHNTVFGLSYPLSDFKGRDEALKDCVEANLMFVLNDRVIVSGYPVTTARHPYTYPNCVSKVLADKGATALNVVDYQKPFALLGLWLFNEAGYLSHKVLLKVCNIVYGKSFDRIKYRKIKNRLVSEGVIVPEPYGRLFLADKFNLIKLVCSTLQE